MKIRVEDFAHHHTEQVCIHTYHWAYGYMQLKPPYELFEKLPLKSDCTTTLKASAHYTTQRLHTTWADSYAPWLTHAHFQFATANAQTRSTTSRGTGELARMVTSRMRHNTSRGVVRPWVVKCTETFTQYEGDFVMSCPWRRSSALATWTWDRRRWSWFRRRWVPSPSSYSGPCRGPLWRPPPSRCSYPCWRWSRSCTWWSPPSASAVGSRPEDTTPTAPADLPPLRRLASPWDWARSFWYILWAQNSNGN